MRSWFLQGDFIMFVLQAKIECSMSQEFTVENVLAALPAFPKGAPQQRAKRAAEALVKAANYSKLMAMQQVSSPYSSTMSQSSFQCIVL